MRWKSQIQTQMIWLQCCHDHWALRIHHHWILALVQCVLSHYYLCGGCHLLTLLSSLWPAGVYWLASNFSYKHVLTNWISQNKKKLEIFLRLNLAMSDVVFCYYLDSFSVYFEYSISWICCSYQPSLDSHISSNFWILQQRLLFMMLKGFHNIRQISPPASSVVYVTFSHLAIFSRKFVHVSINPLLLLYVF